MAHEQRLKEYDNESAPEKKKSLGLKGVIAFESEDGEEGSSEEIATISKRLDRLIKKRNLRRPKRDGFKGEGFKKGIICYNCNKPGHLKSECTLPNKTFKKDKKKKAFNALNWTPPMNLAMMNRKTKLPKFASRSNVTHWTFANCERYDDWIFETLTLLVCHLCSFAHACEGCSLQAGTPESAYATMFARAVLRSLRVEWDRHIPRVGMLGYHRHLGGTSWTTLEPSTPGEARDRGKGAASS
uniref:CCHC-type domain-containing protein n=1 Tax=Ananas comosus var. bracteatus TaxID=296719 RepID=A0A6V7Q5P1_ANACO|nr:unnamed protein product [Ananas comosus var. bracteatus]